jgi:AraC family transcriptional regulator
MALSFQPGQFYGALERRRDGGREEDVEIHTHDDAHFVLVLAGIYICTARGAPAFARAPFLVFNPPGTTHRDRFVDGVGAFATVSLSASTFVEMSDQAPISDAAAPVADARALASAFAIAREISSVGRDPAVLEASAWALMAATAEPEPRPFNTPPAWAFQAFEAVMDLAVDAGLSIADVAAQAGVHPVHLARVFRQAWGCSPGELLRWRRVGRASDLIRHGRMPSAEVAAATGFSDQAHMTRAFRTLLGVTPGVWRRAADVAPIQDPRFAAA